MNKKTLELLLVNYQNINNGILKDCDAVWLKEYDTLFETKKESLEIRGLKYAAFCLNNNASDVAIDVLTKAVKTYGMDLNNLNKRIPISL